MVCVIHFVCFELAPRDLHFGGAYYGRFFFLRLEFGVLIVGEVCFRSFIYGQAFEELRQLGRIGVSARCRETSHDHRISSNQLDSRVHIWAPEQHEQCCARVTSIRATGRTCFRLLRKMPEK